MSIKDLINQAYTKDAGAFEKTFDAIMAEKMGSAIETKYDDMFGAQEVAVEEEVETEEVEVEVEDSIDEGKKVKEEDEDADDDEDEDEDEEDEKKETVSESIKKCYEMAVDEACTYEGDDYPEHTVETYMKEMASLNASMAAETFEKACSKVREGDLTIEMYEAACNEMKDTFAKRIDELKEAWSAK